MWLEYEDCSGRVESTRKEVDIDAIKSYFFTEKTNRFKSRAVLKLHLVVAEDYCDEVMNHLDNMSSGAPSHVVSSLQMKRLRQVRIC